MERKVVKFVTDPRFRRRRREQRTLVAMMSLYCRAHHRSQPLCAECSALARYSQRRLERCVFGDEKPTCANCLVHCYRADMRRKIRTMMRWAGPRMLWRHPVLAVMHMVDGRRPSPQLPERPATK